MEETSPPFTIVDNVRDVSIAALDAMGEGQHTVRPLGCLTLRDHEENDTSGPQLGADIECHNDPNLPITASPSGPPSSLFLSPSRSSEVETISSKRRRKPSAKILAGGGRISKAAIVNSNVHSPSNNGRKPRSLNVHSLAAIDKLEFAKFSTPTDTFFIGTTSTKKGDECDVAFVSAPPSPSTHNPSSSLLTSADALPRARVDMEMVMSHARMDTQGLTSNKTSMASQPPSNLSFYAASPSGLRHPPKSNPSMIKLKSDPPLPPIIETMASASAFQDETSTPSTPRTDRTQSSTTHSSLTHDPPSLPSATLFSRTGEATIPRNVRTELHPLPRHPEDLCLPPGNRSTPLSSTLHNPAATSIGIDIPRTQLQQTTVPHTQLCPASYWYAYLYHDFFAKVRENGELRARVQALEATVKDEKVKAETREAELLGEVEKMTARLRAAEEERQGQLDAVSKQLSLIFK
ncbi:hypothetical protein ONZ45_g16838 [Pleurotus djamor]|nr:hypothetical protein ONZ45_g16838 [Pleurotus djamor]